MSEFNEQNGVALPPKKTSWKHQALDFLQTVLIALVIFLGINTVSARIQVDSYSMEPTLYKGNYVIVSKVAYRFGQPARGDVIVFHFPPNPEEKYIKRLIGLPGDHIHIQDGKVSVNGEQVYEPYLMDATYRGGEWVVPAEAYFVMGDNRNNSSDSRSWGMVPAANIIGKASLVYWPPQQWGVLDFPVAAAAEIAK